MTMNSPRAKRICSTAARRRSKHTTARPRSRQPTSSPIGLCRRSERLASSAPLSPKHTNSSPIGLRRCSKRLASIHRDISSTRYSFSFSIAFKPQIENDIHDRRRPCGAPVKSLSPATTLRLEKAYKILFERPLYSVPQYTVAGLKSDLDILATIKESPTLALSNDDKYVPPLPRPTVPPFILNMWGGLVIGKLTFREIGGTNNRWGITWGTVDCNNGGGMLVKVIPSTVEFVKDMKSDALFILLVRNDYAFNELVDEDFYNRFPCIIVTAEGSPEFLCKLKSDLNLPIIALFDCEPKWLEMLSFYGRVLKDIKWLGIKPTDFEKYKMGDRLTLPMTDDDIEIVKGLLNDDFFKKNPERIEELIVVLECKRKTEIDSFCCFDSAKYLTRVFLPMKLQEENWI